MTMEKVKCPSLDKNYKCKLFKNPKRPSLCRDFPVMVVGNYIITSPICPAVNEGKLNPFLKKLEKEGYKII
jgi:Fe-S-cluster containining protein